MPKYRAESSEKQAKSNVNRPKVMPKCVKSMGIEAKNIQKLNKSSLFFLKCVRKLVKVAKKYAKRAKNIQKIVKNKKNVVILIN